MDIHFSCNTRPNTTFYTTLFVGSVRWIYATAITGGGTLLSYNPVLNSSVAPQVFTYTITDGRGATATATVTVRVSDRIAFTQASYTTTKSAWTLQGTARPGDVVRVLVGTTQVGTATAEAQGGW